MVSAPFGAEPKRPESDAGSLASSNLTVLVVSFRFPLRARICVDLWLLYLIYFSYIIIYCYKYGVYNMTLTYYRIITQTDRFTVLDSDFSERVRRDKSGKLLGKVNNNWEEVLSIKEESSIFGVCTKPLRALSDACEGWVVYPCIVVITGIPMLFVVCFLWPILMILDGVKIYVKVSESKISKLLQMSNTKLTYNGSPNSDSRGKSRRDYGNSERGSSQTPKERYKAQLHKEMREIADGHPELNIETDDDWKPVMELAKMQIWENPEKMKAILSISDERLEEIYTNNQIKEEKKLANHSAFEGRIGSSDKRKLKLALGFSCQACGKNMEDIYGVIGKNYIELHHKVPYSDMKENDTRVLSQDDFYVLCPNCHRMIHKLEDAGDIELLKRIIKLNS